MKMTAIVAVALRVEIASFGLTLIYPALKLVSFRGLILIFRRASSISPLIPVVTFPERLFLAYV